jgi:hypothetical protein
MAAAAQIFHSMSGTLFKGGMQSPGLYPGLCL